MKKLIALVLALVMTFSVATVAFAADETTPDATTTTAAPAEGEEEKEDGSFSLDDYDLGDFAFILDLPLWTAKPMLKVAKIALKLVKVVVKVGAVFGMEPGEIIEAITDLIANSQQNSGEAETTVPETTAAATV